MKVKEENEKAGLKFSIQKANIMAYGPINSWQIDEEIIWTVTDFIFLGSKITADGYCGHEFKRCLLLRRKAVTNVNSILRNRHYFADQGAYSQTYGFSCSHVLVWKLDNKKGWAPKNWSLGTVVLEKTLESTWTTRISNQSILKKISNDYSLEGQMLNLQYFSHLM